MGLGPQGGKLLKATARLASVGIELSISTVIGALGGRWLDGKLGTRWLALVGFVLGCYAGFRALFRAGKQMQRDIENEEKLERGEDPWAEEARELPGEGDTDLTADESVDRLKGDLAAKPALEEGKP